MSEPDVEAIVIVDKFKVPVRPGERPETTPAPVGTDLAQQQVSQNAPRHLQEELFKRAIGLPDVTTGPSLISVPGARAFFLEPSLYKAPQFIANEFGHIHPEYDGSFHLSFNPNLVARIAESGWGVPHPRASMVALVYGPRDEEELEII